MLSAPVALPQVRTGKAAQHRVLVQVEERQRDALGAANTGPVGTEPPVSCQVKPCGARTPQQRRYIQMDLVVDNTK